MNKRQRVLTVAGMITAVSMLTACGGGGGGAEGGGDAPEFGTEATGTLAAWGFENADDVGQSRLDYAAEQLSDLDIELDATAFDAQKFTTRVASGNVPDVVQMDRRYVPTYASQDLIVPLDKCFEAHDVDVEGHWYPSVIDEVTYDDQRWAAPQFYQPPAIIVNKRVMDEAGVAPEDLDTSDADKMVAAIEKMYVEEGGVPTRLGFDPQATGQAGLWILGQGGKLVDEEGVPTLDDPSNIAGIELLKRITDAQGGYAKVKSFTDSFDTFGEKNQFASDQVGAQINAQWYPNVLADVSTKTVDIEAVPFRDKDGEPFSVASGSAFVIPVGAKNPDGACAWVVNLTSDEAWAAAGALRDENVQKEDRINTGLFTGSPEADQAIRDEYVVPTGNEGFDQVISTYYEVVEYGQSYAVSPAGQEIQNELNNAISSALLGDKTPEEALADAQQAAQRAYDNIVD